MTKKKQEDKNSNGYYGLLFVTFTGLFFIAICWYAYLYFVGQKTRDGMVYIKADRSAFKIVPEDPGGMVIEYKDKLVFNKVSGEKEKISKNIKVIEDEKALSEDEISHLAAKSELEQEEFEEAAKVILEPIMKKAKEVEKRLQNEDSESEPSITLDDLMNRIESNKGENEFVDAPADVSAFDEFDISFGNQLENNNAIIEPAEQIKIKSTEDQIELKEVKLKELSPAEISDIEDSKNLEESKRAEELKEAMKNINNRIVKKVTGIDEAKIENEERFKLPTIEVPQKISSFSKPKDLLLPSKTESLGAINMANADVKVEKNEDTGKNKTTITFNKSPKSLNKKPKAAPAAKRPSSSKTKPGFYVQVSSHTKMKDLETEWARFANRFATDVKGHERNVTEARVNGRKFYRLSFGPFSSKQLANRKCSTLKSKGADCLLKFY